MADERGNTICNQDKRNMNSVVVLYCILFCLFVYVFVLDVDSRTSHNLVFHFVSKEWNENLPRGSRSRYNNGKLRYCSKLS